VKILVTGGRGFIGGHLVENLVGKGHEVTVLDRMIQQLPTVTIPWFKTFCGDVCHSESTSEAINLCDRWVNLAGLLGTSELMSRVDDAVEVNIRGAINIFEAALKFGKPGVQIAVGNYWMSNPYAITKRCAEKMALMYVDRGADIRVVRGMNVYGPGQKHRPVRKIFPNVVIPALLNKPVTVYGDGEQVMDMIYVKDAVEILAQVLLLDEPAARVYVAGAGPMTINEVVNGVLDISCSKSMIHHVPMRKGEERRATVSITPSEMIELNRLWSNKFTPKEVAFRNTINWYREHIEEFPWDEE